MSRYTPPPGSGGSSHGIPPGGTTGQFLAKTSDSDYDVEWSDAPSGGSLEVQYGILPADVLVTSGTGFVLGTIDLDEGTWLITGVSYAHGLGGGSADMYPSFAGGSVTQLGGNGEGVQGYAGNAGPLGFSCLVEVTSATVCSINAITTSGSYTIYAGGPVTSQACGWYAVKVAS